MDSVARGLVISVYKLSIFFKFADTQVFNLE
jgi:hypothetical protein